jgi:thiamine kinase-like enzyme
MKKFDDLVLHKLRNFDSSFPADGQHPSPSSIWDNFCSYIKKCTELISWQETVTHGDAHGDNIFFDPESLEIWIIDFARTAKRISIFDLAMIESDLKFRQLPNVLKNDSHIASEEFLERYKQFEEAVASQDTYEKIIIPKIDNDPILRMFSKLIIDIRQLACQKLLRTGSFNDYQIVLFLLSFKFMKVQEISNERILLPYLSALTLQKVRFNLQQSI